MSSNSPSSSSSSTPPSHRHPSVAVRLFEGSVASSSALIFSNPFEVMKTRLQLQGETGGEKIYFGMLDGITKAIKNEGPLALYQGLVSSVLHQITMNGVRLGLFDPTREALAEQLSLDKHNIGVTMVSASATGVLGSFLGNPFSLIKTRLQAQNARAALVEQQHLESTSFGKSYQYRGLRGAARDIFAKEGVQGFYYGLAAGLMRTAVGSAAQLTAYEQSKLAFLSLGAHNDFKLHVASSIVAALSIVTFMTPVDTLTVRLWAGKNFSSDSVNNKKRPPKMITVATSIVKNEGFLALWKGSGALFWRTLPHSMGTFVVLEQLRKLRHKFE